MGLYPTNPPAEVRYLLRDSGAGCSIAEDQEQVDKALAVIDDLPGPGVDRLPRAAGVRVATTTPSCCLGGVPRARPRAPEANPDAVERADGRGQPDDVVTLIYTSGTTGPPKGAMLTVANVEFADRTCWSTAAGSTTPPTTRRRLLSYLPLCHVAERASRPGGQRRRRRAVHFAESIETVQANLREVQPTIFFAVPRIWEKIHAGVEIRWRRRPAQALPTTACGWGGGPHRPTELVRNGGTHTPRPASLYAARLRLPVPGAQGPHRAAQVPPRSPGPRPSRPRS
jgi:long-chain acyl-CoA synthetase